MRDGVERMSSNDGVEVDKVEQNDVQNRMGPLVMRLKSKKRKDGWSIEECNGRHA